MQRRFHQATKGDRVNITGSISYRTREVVDGNGQTHYCKNAVVIATRIEDARLPRKADAPIAVGA